MSERPYPSIGETIRNFLERQEQSIEAIQTEDDIEHIALEVLEEDEYSQYLTDRIRTVRRNQGNDEALVREQRKLFDQVKVEIALVSGVEIDAVEHTRQREQYRNQISEIISSLNQNAPDEEIMKEIGIIQPIEGGRGYKFVFPSRIFPPYIHEQWEVYMGMVEQFEAATKKLQKGVISQTEFSGIDLIRKKAHDTVSQSIGEILEFNDWNLEDYRRFVAKMRDERFAESMGELARYANDFKEEFTSEHLSAINKTLRNHR